MKNLLNNDWKNIVITPVTFGLLILTGGIVTASLMTPTVVEAYTNEITISLSWQPQETGLSFVKRANAVARTAVQRALDQDILVNAVLVTILGENDGIIVPILKVRVDRTAWYRQPDIQAWSEVDGAGLRLLGINSITTTKPQPGETVTDETPSVSNTPASTLESLPIEGMNNPNSPVSF